MNLIDISKVRIIISRVIGLPPDDIEIFRFTGGSFVFFDFPYENATFGLGYHLQEPMPSAMAIIREIEDCIAGYESMED